jgi:hypothetical protein
MPNRKIIEYLSNGSSPFAKWFAGLDAFAAAKVTVALYRLEQGNFQTSKRCEKASQNIK